VNGWKEIETVASGKERESDDEYIEARLFTTSLLEVWKKRRRKEGEERHIEVAGWSDVGGEKEREAVSWTGFRHGK